MTPTLIKVCGLTRQEDADACVKLGVDLTGFIFHSPSPRNVEPGHAAKIETGQALRVGVFVRQDLEETASIMREARLDLAQVHNPDRDPEFCKALGPEKVMRVFWPERYPDRASLEKDLARFEGVARYILLDAGTSGGGHGRSLNFSDLNGLLCPTPWLLAGGLGPHNLERAVAECAPFGVDLNSGVESAPGIKDAKKMARAVEIIKKKQSFDEPKP
ncbi:MAG: phosphoribosylanthranilate isomerase [Thermodesulfobacteriota bacterium]|nr:phosphoribosylanthranilate isomerase [Thermodesulfobacteriota bacterium]